VPALNLAAIVAPVQQSLALTRSTHQVAGLAVPLNLRGEPPDRLPPLDLACVIVRHTAAHEGKPTMKRRRDYEMSSGNVFADLGFRNPKQELLKAKLTVQIYKLLKARGLTSRRRRSSSVPPRHKFPRSCAASRYPSQSAG
jgi:hypothetical protein